MRFFKIIGVVLLFLIGVYFIGPRPASPLLSKDLPVVPADPVLLEKYIQAKESKQKLKPDNEARILWLNDSVKNKTEYALVYIHGFSASQEEGDPVHYTFAQRFGCNLYLSRLAGHGMNTSEPLENLTADELWNSAKEAYAIGRQLGKKVILMSTSTGGTLSLKLAAEFPDIYGLILLSPNIAINDSKAWMLNNHWGLQIAKLVKGKYMHAKDTTAIYKQYWYHQYRTEAVVQLEELLEKTMVESVFKKVTQPALVLYYYKDEQHQDAVVKVTAIKRMFNQLGTPQNLKRMVAVPEAGDHVMGSWIKSKDLEKVEGECEKFAREILRLKEYSNSTNEQ